MKNKINFETLQRFDKVDANDLQENIYGEIEAFTKGMFRSGVYGVANTATKEDNAKRNAMHGPINPIPSVSIDQANEILTITNTFSVVERNTGDVISFTAEDIEEGHNVISMASVQSWVDDNAAAFRQNDIEGGGYTALAIFAYPVSDQKREDRQFYDALAGSSSLNNTVIRNRTRLSLFCDIYEKRRYEKDVNGNYPTLIGKWDLGRIESNVRTDSGGGNYTLNPVAQWPTSAGWVSNLVWNWVLPDDLNVIEAPGTSDRTVANANRLPNTITEPVTLRYDGNGSNSVHDIRLMFKHMQRLIDRIQCAGASDPTDIDFGTESDTVQVLDKYGVQTGDTKTVNSSLHSEHPPYSLRGLKHFIDEINDTRTLHSSINFKIVKDIATFPDNVSRIVLRMEKTAPSGDFTLGVLPDYYDFFNYLGVSQPGSGDIQANIQSAAANASTGIILNVAGQGISSAEAYTNIFRQLVVSLPAEYVNYKITHLSISPTVTLPDHSDASYVFEGGTAPREITGLRADPICFVIYDDDDMNAGAATGWQTSQDFSQGNTVVSISRMNNQGAKVGSPGFRIQLGPETMLEYAYLATNFQVGFNISVGIKKAV